MSQYVALLRGIGPSNPNMRNEKLRWVFKKLGFSDIKTVLASGNIIFSAPKTSESALESEIEKALPTHLGFNSAAIVRTSEEWRQLIAKQPFKGYKHSRTTYLTVTFLKQRLKAATEWPANEAYRLMAAYERELCCTTDVTATKGLDLMPYLDKRFSKANTTRTWKTIEKIAQNLTS